MDAQLAKIVFLNTTVNKVNYLQVASQLPKTHTHPLYDVRSFSPKGQHRGHSITPMDGGRQWRSYQVIN